MWVAHLAAAARDRFPLIAQHVLLSAAGPSEEADERLAERARAAVGQAIASVPGEWLAPDEDGRERRRADITRFFAERLERPRPWIDEVERARP